MIFINQDDIRSSALAELLINDDYITDQIEDLKYCDLIYMGKKGINRKNILILNKEEVYIDDQVFLELKENCLIITLIENDYLNELSNKYHFRYLCLLNNQKFNKHNCILTAEGLISFMIAHSHYPLFNSNILILGNGNCTREIVHLLKSFDCFIDIGCRNKKELFNRQLYFNEINYQKYDYIINTIPSRIVNDCNLDSMNKNTIIFDIASFPYGLDHGYALSQNIQTYIIPSIPSMYAYEYGAHIMKKIMEEYL